jgi:uncharacterized protein YoxC
MDSLLVVVEIIALASVAALCIFLFFVMVRVRSLLIVIEKDLKEFSAKAMPVIENLEVITDRVKTISENIDEQVEVLKGAVNSFKDIAENIVDFERRVQDRIEEPVLETVSTFAAIFKGVRTFVTRLRA